MKNIVLVTGGFDPIHSGHISYFNAARKLGDQLVVGVNSDAWLARKKGRPFMPYAERVNIVANLSMVDQVIGFNDVDDSACDAIETLRRWYPEDRIIFANGGDRTQKNIPEMEIKIDNVDFQFGVGGENKANSSSWILDDWRAPKTLRSWGYYRVLHEGPGVKVKELTVNPGDALSMQRHHHRAEFWLVDIGQATVYTIDSRGNSHLQGQYGRHQYLHIELGQWHKLINEEPDPLKIIEIQYGTYCDEQDIERL